MVFIINTLKKLITVLPVLSPGLSSVTSCTTNFFHIRYFFFIPVTKYLSRPLKGIKVYSGSQFEGIQSAMAGKGWGQEQKAAHHIEPEVSKLTERNQGAQFSFSFLFLASFFR